MNMSPILLLLCRSFKFWLHNTMFYEQRRLYLKEQWILNNIYPQKRIYKSMGRTRMLGLTLTLEVVYASRRGPAFQTAETPPTASLLALQVTGWFSLQSHPQLLLFHCHTPSLWKANILHMVKGKGAAEGCAMHALIPPPSLKREWSSHSDLGHPGRGSQGSAGWFRPPWRG